jgi:predicted nucleotidyltransferase
MAEGKGGGGEGRGMRLKQRDIDAIKAAACAAFGPSAVVRLFGSRVDDHARGGDIDLLLEVDPVDDGRSRTALFRRRLFDRIDEQKVDVVLMMRGHASSAFARMVSADAVPLP